MILTNKQSTFKKVNINMNLNVSHNSNLVTFGRIFFTRLPSFSIKITYIVSSVEKANTFWKNTEPAQVQFSFRNFTVFRIYFGVGKTIKSLWLEQIIILYQSIYSIV